MANGRGKRTTRSGTGTEGEKKRVDLVDGFRQIALPGHRDAQGRGLELGIEELRHLLGRETRVIFAAVKRRGKDLGDHQAQTVRMRRPVGFIEEGGGIYE